MTVLTPDQGSIGELGEALTWGPAADAFCLQEQRAASGEVKSTTNSASVISASSSLCCVTVVGTLGDARRALPT